MQTQETAKLSHRNDPDASREAAVKLVKSGWLSRQEGLVYAAILEHPYDSFTPKELAAQSGLDYHLISRRLGGLECTYYNPRGKIERTIYRRNGCAVWKRK